MINSIERIEPMLAALGSATRLGPQHGAISEERRDFFHTSDQSFGFQLHDAELG
jgi:hypothetical protein